MHALEQEHYNPSNQTKSREKLPILKKMTMAQESEYFSIGSIVSCVTCHNQKIEGEVVAFDYLTKMLVLKCSNAAAKSNLHDVHMVNLNLVENVVVTKEAPNNAPALPPLNLEKLHARARHQIEERQRLVSAMSSGVSPEGLTLFLAITKTINEVTWQGKNIVVMNQVTISPPYRPENCRGKTADSDALNHVKKIATLNMLEYFVNREFPVVEKHIKDQQSSQQARSPSSSGTTQDIYLTKH